MSTYLSSHTIEALLVNDYGQARAVAVCSGDEHTGPVMVPLVVNEPTVCPCCGDTVYLSIEVRTVNMDVVL